jgi:hypothetical protein
MSFINFLLEVSIAPMSRDVSGDIACDVADLIAVMKSVGKSVWLKSYVSRISSGHNNRNSSVIAAL